MPGEIFPRRAFFSCARYRHTVASRLHPRILATSRFLSLPVLIAARAGSQLACGPVKRLPGAGWRSPQATERRSVPLLVDRVLILHDHAGPGRGAEVDRNGNEQGGNRLRAVTDRRSGIEHGRLVIRLVAEGNSQAKNPAVLVRDYRLGGIAKLLNYKAINPIITVKGILNN